MSSNDDKRIAYLLVTLLHKSASVLVLTSIALVLAASAFSQQRTATPGASVKKPNVIFILADDWGWGDLGVYGHEQLRTPNLDGLAGQGTLFTQFYVAGSVCSPSRAAFMTGHYPARHRIHGHIAEPAENARRGMPNFLDPTIPTVTKLLKDAGYTTGHFGKWHLGSGPGAQLPNVYGIDDYVTLNGNDKRGAAALGGAPNRPRSSELIINETIRFVEANRDKPFFVNTWLFDTHAVLAPTEEQMKAYPNMKGALRIYYSAATNADHHIGRLLKRLDELGLSENTIVIFSSDNGPEDIHISNASHSGVGSAGPFRGRKRSLYEGGVRVPFIVRWPGRVPTGRVDNRTVFGGVDFLPTICSLAGAKLPGNLALDGEDLSAALLGKSVERTKPLFWEWRFKIFGHTSNKSPMLAMRDGRWKLLMNPDRSRVELYDMTREQTEMNNMASQHDEVVAKMSKRVLQWQQTLPPGPVEKDAGSDAYRFPGAK